MHPQDKIPCNSTLEIEYANKKTNSANNSTYTNKYSILQNMTNSGEFNVNLDQNTDLVSKLRIRFSNGTDHWVIITEITLT